MSELQVFARPRFLQAKKEYFGGVAYGQSLFEIVQEVYRRGDIIEPLQRGTVVQINGEIVPREQWKEIKPSPASEIVVSVGVHGGRSGGKNPLSMILSLAVVVAAPYLGSMFGTSLALGMFGGGVATASQVALATGLITGVVGIGGLLAVNALFPTRTNLNTPQTYSDSPTYSISGAQNEARKFSPIPVVLGRRKQVPPLGALSYTELCGNDEFLRMLVVWGYGPLKIENIKRGDTLLSEYDGVEIETREGRASDAPITLIPSQVIQDSIGVTLTAATDWVVRTSKTNADELSVDISFPSGLVEYTSNGSRASRSVVIELRYRLVGASEWITLDPFNVADKFVGNLRKGRRWTVSRGQYEIGMRRTTADSSSDQIVDKVNWSYLRTFRSSSPIKFPHPLAVSAIRIKASEQLQSVIDDLNAIVTSYAPVWDGTAWGGEAPTQNPAALMRLVLTGPANARARTASQVYDENLGAFYQFCEANGYMFNMVRDYTASVWDVCSDICSAARAAPTIIDGKWGVIMDTPNKPIAQHFTPRNSWGFKGKRSFVCEPHALRVKFADEDNNYENDERIVCADGYTEATATEFESIEFPGLTSRNLNWKFGRYNIAQAKLRPQTYTLNCDFEHLRCQRGDLVRVGHDVPMWGSGTPRVKSLIIEAEKIAGVQIDDKVIMESGKAYACRFRQDDGESLVMSINTVSGEVDTLHFQTCIPQTQNLKPGDLAMFGEANRETQELLVKAIRPTENLCAEIELVDFAPEIYQADQGEIPAFTPNITAAINPTKVAPVKPIIVGLESGTAALEKSVGGIKPRILVSLQAGASSVRISQYNVRYCLHESTDWRYVQQTAEQSVVALGDVQEGESYIIQARSKSIYDVPSDWTEVVTEAVVGQSERPANVSDFDIKVVNGLAYLTWGANTELDLSHYQVRWNRLQSGATWGGSMIVDEKPKGTSLTTQALDGTYLIKAVDLSGNESATATIVTNNSTRLASMNYIAQISQETPTWNGTGDGVIYDEAQGGLILAAGVYEGVYVLSDKLDLGGIFPVLVTASITSTSVNLNTDLYSFDDLYAAGDLYGVTEGLTSVSVNLSNTTDGVSGAPVWSDWSALLVGEYAKRGFQLQLKLKRSDLSVTPVVTAVSVQFDMKDRIYRFNQAIPLDGARVTISPPFYAVPEIPAPNVLNGQEGDMCKITNIDVDGFNANVTNGGVNVGPRTISGAAFSYGEKVI